LLRHLIAQPESRNIAVVINELGEVGLDHLLVANSSEDLMLMSSGCLCCTVRNDLILTLRQLYKRREAGEVMAFDRVVVETTGLADPAPILHALMTDPLLSAFYRLDGVVTVVDAIHGMAQFDSHAEAVKQAALADRLVVSKVDLASAAAKEELHARLRRLNPAAALLDAVAGHVAPAALFNAGLYDPSTKSADARRWLNEEAYAAEPNGDHSHDHDQQHDHALQGPAAFRHDAEIHSFCLTADQPLDWARLVEWVEGLVAQNGENILRLKGVLNVAGETQPIALHGVQHVLHPPALLPRWQDDDRRSRMVFIGRDLDHAAVASSFRERVLLGASAAPTVG
jgi:G3E family GTPase